jgi:hypothetical protein
MEDFFIKVPNPFLKFRLHLIKRELRNHFFSKKAFKKGVYLYPSCVQAATPL